MKPEISEKEPDKDLFGHPVIELRDRRGRPSYKVTLENQQFVAVRAAAGWTQDAIADDMGIDPKTLRKNFSRELHGGALMIEGQLLDVLSQKARQGHVPSAKALADLVDKGQRRQAARQFKDEPQEVEGEVGKKEARRRAALEAAQAEEGEWSDDLKPGQYDA